MKMFLVAVCVLSAFARADTETNQFLLPSTVGLATPSLPVYDKSTNKCSEYCSNYSRTCSEKLPDSCPPGLFCESGHCECGEYPNSYLKCNGTGAELLRIFCITFDPHKNMTSVGNCLRQLSPSASGVNYADHTLYNPLPNSVHDLDRMMCRSFNRTGTLCGRCLPDHYPLAYSFNITCIPCPRVCWNWFRYIMAAYLPLTVFYLIVLFFKINTTSSHLFVVIYCCQSLSMPALLRNLFIGISDSSGTHYVTAIKVLYSAYGVWNLDFFRPFYSDLCLGIGILPTLALDYAIAVYPLFLMIISYLLVTLYGRNYKIVTLVWSPFRVLFSRLRRKWDMKTSVVDAYATFFFLSNVKFFSASFDLLIPMKVYQLHPKHYNYTLGLFYAADIEYFGREHLPYAVLAMVVLVLFVLLPVLFIGLYGSRPVHKISQIFSPSLREILHRFAHCYRGCYSSGREPGTCNYQWFASVFFLVRLCHFVLFTITDKVMFLAFSTTVLVIFITLLAVTQPFKSTDTYHNAISIIFLQLMTLLGLTSVVICSAIYMAPQFMTLFYVLGAIYGTIPLLFFIASVCYWACSHKTDTLNAFRAWRFGYDMLPDTNDELPDRIEHSCDYPRENLANLKAKQMSSSIN